MEADCFDFAVADSEQEYNERKSVIASLQGNCSLAEAAALYSGLVFSRVFNFALFPDVAGNPAVENYSELKQLMIDRFMPPDRLKQYDDFAWRLSQGFLTGERSGRDVSMSGHYQWVLANWQQFAATLTNK